MRKKASRHQGIKASRHRGIEASRHEGIKASRHQVTDGRRHEVGCIDYLLFSGGSKSRVAVRGEGNPPNPGPQTPHGGRGIREPS